MVTRHRLMGLPGIGALLLLVALAWAPGCQPTIRPEVEAMAQQIREAEEIQGSQIGMGLDAPPGDIYLLQKQLVAEASANELVLLTDDVSPIVRYYAFMGLRNHHPDVDILPLLLQHLKDSEYVEYQMFDMVEGGPLCHLLANHIGETLAPTQKQELLEWLLTEPNNLQLRTVALEEWPIDERHHDDVRRLAQADEPGALIGLARFKDPADVPIILSRLTPTSYDSLRAVEEFPHPAFFDRLVEMHQTYLAFTEDEHDRVSDPWGAEDGKGWFIEELYGAVIAYETPAARELLATTLDLPDDSPAWRALNMAFEAVVWAERPYFDDLVFDMLEEMSFPSLQLLWETGETDPQKTLLRRLYETDPPRMTRLIKRMLADPHLAGHDRNAVITMVGLFIEHADTEADRRLYINALATVDEDYCFSRLVTYPVHNQVSWVVPGLMDLLSNDEQPRRQYEAAAALAWYNQPDILQEMRRRLEAGEIRVTDAEALEQIELEIADGEKRLAKEAHPSAAP